MFADDDFCVRVRDDGVGIDAGRIDGSSRTGHWGLPGMHERAHKIGAQLDLWSRPGAGTEVELRIPAKMAYVGRTRLLRWLSFPRPA